MVSPRCLFAFCSIVLVALSRSAPAAADQCPGGPCVTVGTVDQTFRLGSRFRFGITRCPCEGLIFNDIRYTPKGGPERLVLYQANVAQIHVPYTMGTPRFHDMTRDGPGLGFGAQTLTQAECEGGSLRDGDHVCVQLEERGYAWKAFDGFALGQAITIWMPSRVGAYTYINKWTFRDDGAIEPELGLTGQLQAIRKGAQYLPYGTRMNAESDPEPSVGISHVHNIFYRLDFDLGGSEDDAVERLSFSPSTTPSPEAACNRAGQCGLVTATPIEKESVDFLIPNEMTVWRIFDKSIKNADGRNIGYEIEPRSGSLWTGMASGVEPWSSGELWVTAYDKCEQLAFDNAPPYLPAACAGAPADVTAMVSGANPLSGADIVVWYATRYLHIIRDEDGPHMPVEWTGFSLLPRSFHFQDPLE